MFDISPTEWTAIALSLRVALVATLVATPLGIALGWLLAPVLVGYLFFALLGVLMFIDIFTIPFRVGLINAGETARVAGPRRF